jgi:hypothetical protein
MVYVREGKEARRYRELVYRKFKYVHAHVRLGVLFVYVPGQGSSNVFAYTGVLPVEPNDLDKLIRKKRKIMLQL